MVLFPNCKINLGLNIVRKREDGYHDLETVFYPVLLCDALEAVKGKSEGIHFSVTGLPVTGRESDNLCVKAWHLLQKDFPALPSMEMHLHKTIPMGAGLGGGSADGAFALQLINTLCGLGLSQEQLIRYAIQLGSDCPFFILNQPCFAAGRGEKMQELVLDLPAYRFVLVNPGIHISTREAFTGIHPAIPPKSIRTIMQQPIETWKQELVNDFETPVFALHPQLAAIKEELYRQGATYASMTGTGSTIFGLFPRKCRPVFNFEKNWRIFETD